MQLNLSLTRLFNLLNKKPFLYVHLPLILYWSFLFIMTSIPVEKLPKFFSTQDKLEHFIAYMILGILLKMSFTFQLRYTFAKTYSLLLSLIVIYFYAFLDEIHQLFIPGRYCDFYDWIFDIIGGTAGVFLIYYLLRMKQVDKILH